MIASSVLCLMLSIRRIDRWMTSERSSTTATATTTTDGNPDGRRSRHHGVDDRAEPAVTGGDAGIYDDRDIFSELYRVEVQVARRADGFSLHCPPPSPFPCPPPPPTFLATSGVLPFLTRSGFSRPPRHFFITRAPCTPQANPALRGQLPQFMRRMADPQNVQALAQMQQSMQQLQQAGVFPPGMMPGMPGAGGAGGAGAGDPMAGLNAFSNLHLGGSGGERTHCCTDPGLGWVGLGCVGPMCF